MANNVTRMSAVTYPQGLLLEPQIYLTILRPTNKNDFRSQRTESPQYNQRLICANLTSEISSDGSESNPNPKMKQNATDGKLFATIDTAAHCAVSLAVPSI